MYIFYIKILLVQNKNLTNFIYIALIRDIVRKYSQSRSVTRDGKRKFKDLLFRSIEKHFLSKCLFVQNIKGEIRDMNAVNAILSHANELLISMNLK